MTPEGFTTVANSFFDGDVEYVPFVKDGRVGYQVNDTAPEITRTTYIYFNPSTRDGDPGEPNVFVYMGERNDPAQDLPLHFYDIEWGAT